MAEKNTIGALDRAIDILEYIHRGGGEATITAISTDLGLYKSLVHRVLQTLKARNFVYQDTVGGKYGLGARIFILGKTAENNMGLVKLVRPFAQELNEKYNECIHVTIPYAAEDELPKQLLIDKVMNRGTVLTVSPPVGAVTLCHASASGKCMLAFFGKDWLERFRHLPLIYFTQNTITDWNVLDEQLENIRSVGFSTEDGETENGLSCTAVPILQKGGKVCAVLSVSGPTSRLRSLDQDSIIADLKRAAIDIQHIIS